MFTTDWYKSKTIWLGIVAAIFGLLNTIGIQLPGNIDQAQVVSVVTAVFGVLAIIFRWSTDTVIAQSKKGTQAIAQGFVGGQNTRQP